MQARETKMDFIDEWANFVKTNDRWKKIHTKFINSYIEWHRELIKEILKTKNGKEKIIKIYKIKNIKGYKDLLNNTKSL